MNANYITFFWHAGDLESFQTEYPPYTMLAFVPGDEARATTLAKQLIDLVPWNWKLVLVCDRHTRLSDEWFVRWRRARVFTWQEGVHGALYDWSSRLFLRSSGSSWPSKAEHMQVCTHWSECVSRVQSTRLR